MVLCPMVVAKLKSSNVCQGLEQYQACGKPGAMLKRINKISLWNNIPLPLEDLK